MLHPAATALAQDASAESVEDDENTLHPSIVDIMDARNAAIPKEQEPERGKVGIKVIGGIRLGPGAGIFRETVGITRRDDNTTFCSGVLIDEKAVLTAAHCVCAGQLNNPEIENVVRFGSTYSDPVYIKIDAKKTRFLDGAENFCLEYADSPNRAMFGRDIALLFLDDAELSATKIFKFSYRGYGKAGDFVLYASEKEEEDKSVIYEGVNLDEVYVVAPARIASAALYLARSVTSLHVVGFGISRVTPSQPGGDPSSAGLKLYAPVQIADKICGTQYIRDRFGCAGGREAVLIDEKHDSCRGDSGGPVFVVVRDKYFLVGLVSRGIAANDCGAGGIYSLITPRVIDWLRDNNVTLHSVKYPEQ
jgi:V8-like Glu-specific endopeptidase